MDKYKDCELFPEKGKFDKEDRLKKIKEIGGRRVTIYIVNGKNNVVKTKYTGTVDITLVNENKLSISTLTKVLVVSQKQNNGTAVSYFPLTYDRNYRIYLTDCLDHGQ